MKFHGREITVEAKQKRDRRHGNEPEVVRARKKRKARTAIQKASRKANRR